jgi:hypothetical protein
MGQQERNEGKAGISDLTVIAFVTSFLFPLVGWILGFRARKQIVDSDGKYSGRPFATAAIWIGGILTSGFVAMVLLMSFGNKDGDGFGWMNHHRMHQGWTAYQPLNGNQNNDGSQGFGRGMMGGFAQDPSQDPNNSTNP